VNDQIVTPNLPTISARSSAFTSILVTPDRSNSLPDLAARIRAEHEATAAALQSSVTHAMAAGDALIEAKAAIPHGGWLPWLADNCDMKLAKNRATIEKHIRNDIADLTLNEAAALCVLAGRIEKLLEIAKRAETLSGEDLVDLYVEQGFSVIVDKSYDPFAGRSEIEQRDWVLFGWFIGNGSESAFDHVEWLLQRPFQNVEEWLGPEGDKCRARWGMKPVPTKCHKAWAKFHAEHAHMTVADIKAELERIRAKYHARQQAEDKKQMARILREHKAINGKSK
jgi:hypothetical protein